MQAGRQKKPTESSPLPRNEHKSIWKEIPKIPMLLFASFCMGSFRAMWFLFIKKIAIKGWYLESLIRIESIRPIGGGLSNDFPTSASGSRGNFIAEHANVLILSMIAFFPSFCFIIIVVILSIGKFSYYPLAHDVKETKSEKNVSIYIRKVHSFAFFWGQSHDQFFQ